MELSHNEFFSLRQHLNVQNNQRDWAFQPCSSLRFWNTMLSFRPPALHTVRGLEVIHIVKFFGQLCRFNGKRAVSYFQLRTSPRIVKSANASLLCLQLQVLMNPILFFSETNFLVKDGRDKKRSLVQTHAEGCIFCTKKMVKMRAEMPASIGAWRSKIWCQIIRPAEKRAGHKFTPLLGDYRHLLVLSHATVF